MDTTTTTEHTDDGPGAGERVRARDGKVPDGCHPSAIATCDRCGRTFPARYAYCVCRG